MNEEIRRVIRCAPEDYGAYRYLLEVQLAEAPLTKPRLAVILKNPSTAGLTRSDPTVGKVEAWARRQGFGVVAYTNLFARRSTRPAPLNGYEYSQAIGPENDRYIMEAAAQADTIVAAWGNCNGIDPQRYNRRIGEVLALLRGYPLKMVGACTRQGYPRHGLLWNNAPALSNLPTGHPYG